jgi:N utilization substance protein A
VRLASKLVGWDIEIMTREELNEQLDKSIDAFSSVPGAPDQMAENLVEQGFFSFDDLSVIEPEQLAELSGLSLEECAPIVEYAERESERLERETAAQKAEGHRARAAAAAAAAAGEAESPTAESEAPAGEAVGVALESAETEEVAESEAEQSAAVDANGEEEAHAVESAAPEHPAASEEAPASDQ